MKKAGFTLVELLVVISIIGVLMGMLLPAVNSARESARRMQCCNNAKQMALATISYQQTHNVFPPASNAESYGVTNQTGNWVYLCFPFLDQQGLYDELTAILDAGNKFEDNKSAAVGNRTVNMADLRQTEIAFFKCPSDISLRIKYNNSWGRLSYGCNMGLDQNPHYSSDNTWDGPNRNLYCGVMGPKRSIALDEIKDGASNTVLIGEIRIGVCPEDPRGTWGLNGAGCCGIACHGWHGDDYGPNCTIADSDDVSTCSTIRSIMGADTLLRMKMSCYVGNENIQCSMRSMHSGGVNCVFADGSTHWISDSIQCTPNSSNLSVWDRINLSMDGNSVSSDSY